MKSSRIARLLLTAVCLCLFGNVAVSKESAKPRLHDLLDELDQAGLRLEFPRMEKLLDEWKRLEPTSASPWLKEMALKQMSGNYSMGECLDVLRLGLKSLPQNQILHARLAGDCAVNQRPQEALFHYRWLFEHAPSESEKMAWISEMATVEDKSHSLNDWVLWQSAQAPQDVMWFVRMRRLRDFAGWGMDREKAHALAPDNEFVLCGFRNELRSIIDDLDGFRQKVNRFPRVENRLILAQRCIYAGEHEEALAILKEVASRPELSPAEAEAVAGLYFEEADWQGAINFLQPRCEAEQENYRYVYLLGCAQQENRQLDAAKATFLKLCSIRRDIVAGHPPLETFLVSHTPGSSRRPFHSSFKFRPQMPYPAESMRVMFFSPDKEHVRGGPGKLWHSYGYMRQMNHYYDYVRHDLMAGVDGEMFVPSTLEEAVVFAMPHLSALWCELPPDQRDAFEKALWKCGIPAKAVLRCWAPGREDAEITHGWDVGWECDAMSPLGVAGTRLFCQDQTWPMARETYRTMAKANPIFAKWCESALAFDPKSTEIWKGLNKQSYPDIGVPKSSQTEPPVVETIAAFPESVGQEIPQLPPLKVAANLQPVPLRPILELSNCLAAGSVSDEFWQAFRREIAWNYLTELPALKVPAHQKLLHPRVGQMSEVTPRAVVEKALAFLYIGDKDSAYQLYFDALNRSPQNRTLQVCAIHQLGDWDLLYDRWGIEPFLNRLSFWGNSPPDRWSFTHQFVAGLNELPDWRLDVCEFSWLREWIAEDEMVRRAALRIPQWAEEAFKTRAEKCYASKGNWEELVDDARLALLAQGRLRIKSPLTPIQDEPAVSNPTSAAQVLLRKCRKDHSEKLLIELMQTLSHNGSPHGERLATVLGLTRELYFGAPAIVKSLLKRAEGFSLNWMKDVASERGISTDSPAK